MIEILMLVIGMIAAVAAILALPQIPKIIEKRKIQRYNSTVCDPINELSKDFLKEAYGIELGEKNRILVDLKKIGRPESKQSESYTWIIFPEHWSLSLKDKDLEVLSEIISLRVKKPILDELTKKGFDIESAEEISTQNTKDFLDEKIANSKLVKGKESIETLKAKISGSETQSVKKDIIRKNYSQIKKIIRDNYKKTDLKNKFNDFLAKNKDFEELVKEDVGEILKIKQRRMQIKDDSVIETRTGREVKFNKNVTERLIELKRTFLAGKNKFMNRVKKIDCRSEQIYALILAYPGRYYELEMSNIFDIPQSTVSLYAERMNKDGFIIKDTYSAKGNFVYLFPRFEPEEIKNYSKLLSKYETLALIGRVSEKNKSYYLEGFETTTLNYLSISQYLGRTVFLRGIVNQDGSMKVNFIISIEPKAVQTRLPKYLAIFA